MFIFIKMCVFVTVIVYTPTPVFIKKTLSDPNFW